MYVYAHICIYHIGAVCDRALSESHPTIVCACECGWVIYQIYVYICMYVYTYIMLLYMHICMRHGCQAQ